MDIVEHGCNLPSNLLSDSPNQMCPFKEELFVYVHLQCTAYINKYMIWGVQSINLSIAL